jgi:hypothetical protein
MVGGRLPIFIHLQFIQGALHPAPPASSPAVLQGSKPVSVYWHPSSEQSIGTEMAEHVET